MLKILLWIVGAILALDVLIVALLVAFAILLEHRTPWSRDARADPDPLEPADPLRPRGSLRLVGPTDAPLPQIRHRRAVGRVAAAAVVAVMLCAGTIAASPKVRHVVAGAFDAVTGGTGGTTGVQAEGTAQNAGPDAAPGADPASSSGSVTTPPRDAHGSGVATAPTGDHQPSNGSADVVLKPDSPPTLNAAPVSATQIDLSWTDVGNETGYRVERWTDGDAAWSPIATTGQDIRTYTDAGLSPGTTYAYRIFATNGEGDSPPSGVARATTSVEPASPPTLIAGSASPSQIDLSWTDVANETGYRVERSSDGTGGWTMIATLDHDVTAFSDTDLAPGTTYFYRVFATNAAGDSPPSDVTSATTAIAPVTDPTGTAPAP